MPIIIEEEQYQQPQQQVPNNNPNESQQLLLGCPDRISSYIDDDDDDDDGGGSEEGAGATSSSIALERSKKSPLQNGRLVLPFRPMGSFAKLPSLPQQQLERKKTVFKISTVSEAPEGYGSCVTALEYGRECGYRRPRRHSYYPQQLLLDEAQLLDKDHKQNLLGPTAPQHSAAAVTHCPYKIWRENFLREHQYGQADLCRELFLASLPHLVVFVVVALYILVGAFLFRLLDEQLANLALHDILLFAFTTITTIGYGNIVPQSACARAFCAPYCLIGIPLVFLTLANVGELLADCYWIAIASLKGRKDILLVDEASRLPLKVILLLILIHSLLGGLIFHFWIQRMPIFPAIYFSFISITTIGFGDISPEPENMFESMVIIFYLSSGISVMSTLFNTLSDHLRRLHYLGRDFRGAQEVRVWFGGQRLSVRELVALVAERFECPPPRLREVLAELDVLIRLAHTAQRHQRPQQTDSANTVEQHHYKHERPKPTHTNNNDVTVTVVQQQKDEDGAEDDEELEEEQDELLMHSYSSPGSSINSEQQQLLQALSTLHRLSVKGSRTFHCPSLNSLSLLRCGDPISKQYTPTRHNNPQQQHRRSERDELALSRSLSHFLNTAAAEGSADGASTARLTTTIAP